MAELSRVIWKPIPGTCGIYEVSNFGEIRDKKTKRLLHISCNSKGYAIVNMQRKLYKVHRIVAENFVKKPKTDKILQIDHIDRNKMNNDSKNLRWVTAAENRKNTGERAKYQTHVGKKIKRICVETGEEINFPSLKSAAESVGMGLSTIFERLHDGRPTKSGFKFMYDGDCNG